MTHAIVAGVPMRVSRRVSAILSDLESEEWQFSIVASRDQNRASIGAKQIELLQRSAAERDGAHILALSDDDRDAARIAAELKPYFRFRWLKSSHVHTISQDSAPFVDEMKSVLNEETSWQSRVKPTSKESALVLPQGVFRCTGVESQIWRLAEKYNDGPSFFEVVEKRIERFTQQYRQRVQSKGHYAAPRYWIDEGRRVWKDDGPLHGDAPFPRDWKYSCKLPERFHYDVEHELAKSFSLGDCHGKTHQVKQDSYLNVDAHGWVR